MSLSSSDTGLAFDLEQRGCPHAGQGEIAAVSAIVAVSAERGHLDRLFPRLLGLGGGKRDDRLRLGFAHRRGRRFGRRGAEERRQETLFLGLDGGSRHHAGGQDRAAVFENRAVCGSFRGLDRCRFGLPRRCGRRRCRNSDRLVRGLGGFGRNGILIGWFDSGRCGNLIGQGRIAFAGYGLAHLCDLQVGRGRTGVVVGGGRQVERGFGGRRTGRQQNREKRGQYGTAFPSRKARP